MKILYLKGYKWLLSQNQQIKLIKPFLKNINASAPTIKGLRIL